MPSRSYQLINPIIEGTFRDVYDAKEPIEAAKHMWVNLTEHIVSHVPKFMFTMKDISSGDLHHFEVAEDKETGTYTINAMDLSIERKQFDEFAKSVDDYGEARKEKEEQKGGKRKRYEDDSSSSSSSTDIYPTIRRTSPIAMFHYNTRVYYTNTRTYPSVLNPQIVAVNTPLFTPIFRPVLGTFVGIWP
jgi:hypothetical protein